MMLLQAQEPQRLPANPQKPGGEDGAEPPSLTSGGTSPAHILVSDFWPPECQTVNFFANFSVCGTLFGGTWDTCLC